MASLYLPGNSQAGLPPTRSYYTYMAANGYHAYDLTGQLEFWSDADLIAYINDSDVMMGLEKHHIIRLAQELADRFPNYDEEEEEDGYWPDGRFSGREDNE